jgi:hypothetical protein
MDDACGIVVLYYCITNHAGASLFANITATNWRFHLKPVSETSIQGGHWKSEKKQ